MEEYGKLLTLISEREIREMLIGIEDAVRRSAIMRPQPIFTEASRITREEWLRRAKWCIKQTLELKKEKHWPVERICDWLRSGLIDWLDEKDQVVSPHAMWSPEGG